MDKKQCKHSKTTAKITVHHLEDVGRYSADLEITCDECGVPFQFIGMAPGWSHSRPMASASGQEARLPIHPVGETIPKM